MKNLLITLIPAVLVTSSAFAVEGESSTVNFVGTIVQASCSLTTESQDQTVDLGSVLTSTLARQGATSDEKPFIIGLEDCDSSVLSEASIAFSGETANDTTLSTNDIANTAVGIQILQDGNELVLDGSAKTTPQQLEDGVNIMEFTARYVAISDQVAAGEANAVANFVIHYE